MIYLKSDDLPKGVRLDGRVAVVTGGGRGLGKAIALGFAAAGAAGVVVTSGKLSGRARQYRARDR